MDLTGMLTKRGNKLKTWRRRYFELHNNTLCYYVYNGGPRKGEYVLDAQTTVVENNLRVHGFCLVQHNGRTLYMSADNEADKDMWMNGLREVITAIQAEIVNQRPNSTRNRLSLAESLWAEEKGESHRDPEIPEIHLRILEARDLAAKGSTDTYAKIILGGHVIQTKISKKDLNPVWNELFHFPWTYHLRFARIEVWDNDPMLSARDNFLGVTYIPLLSLPQHHASPKWCKLGKRTSKSHVTGEIKIVAYCDSCPDVNAQRILREIQNIPELNHGNGANVASSKTWKNLFEDNHPDNFSQEFIGRFPTQFPPLETECLEDLSLLVSLRPSAEKLSDSQSFYTDGLLLLTNYRLIFVSHRRLAFASEARDFLNQSFGETYELSCDIPLASIVSISMNLQPDPSAPGNSSSFLDALMIRTNDSKNLCFIFHHTETTSYPDISSTIRGRGSSVQFTPNAQIRIDQKAKQRNFRRRSSVVTNKLFQPFQKRRSSIESSISDKSQRGILAGLIRRRSLVNTSLGDELSYLEGPDAPEGPPCQRMMTRINNKVINRLAEVFTYEMIHSDLLTTILHSLSATNHKSSLDNKHSNLSGNDQQDKDLYFHWMQQLANPYRSFLSKAIVDGWNIYDPLAEFQRMGIPDDGWRISKINAEYEVCSTYPAILAVPTCLDDHRIVMASQFRSRHRLPAFSWRHPVNRCCLCRASQPLVGLSQNRSIDDEVLLEAIRLSSRSGIDSANHSPSPADDRTPLIIVDARPKINAQANQAAGKGYEIGKGYEHCHVLFMGIANIHVMRKSIDMLEDLCCNSTNDDTNWLKNVEATGWLHHISRVLAAAVRIVHCIAFENYSVLVHCSDGWDRTAQLTSLPMLMMDPFYRTYQGFMILIEKEWFSFGHKFADRLGWTESSWGDSERSPVFHQFLDCVHQCLLQNPNIFEFNQDMLVFIGKHVLSGWFGNAFANCELDRSAFWDSTVSIWTFLDLNQNSFVNPYYQPLQAPYWIPNTGVRYLQIWEMWFLKWSNSVWDLIWRKRNEDFSEQHDDPSVWMEDSMTQCCCDCQKPFNLIRRRHHCRACGRIFCENCVRQTRILPTISEKIPVRCCQDCSNQMSLAEDENQDQKLKLNEKVVAMKNSPIEFGRKFFGKKPSHEEVVAENEGLPDARLSSINQHHQNSKAIPLKTKSSLSFSLSLSEEEQLSPSERDTETIFGQLIDEAEPLTMYPPHNQIASVKINPSAGLADHPHLTPRDPHPIDHLLSSTVNHRPFNSFEYSDSDSELEEEEEDQQEQEESQILQAQSNFNSINSHRQENVEEQEQAQQRKKTSLTRSLFHHEDTWNRSKQMDTNNKKSKSQSSSRKKDGVKAESQRQKTRRSKSPPKVRRTRSPSTSPLRSAI